LSQTVHNIDLGYVPRAHFVPVHKRTKRWAAILAHRRAGKTVACINDLVDWALRCDKPDGRFAYVAPTYGQAKDVAWTYLKAATGPIPGAEQRESDLMVNLPNGARVRLYGADNYDRMRGIYLDGVIMDEIADIDPRAWLEVIRPALSDRSGWAVFIGTPKGRNRFYEMWKQARANTDDWFTLELKASQTGIIPEDELSSARATMNPSQYAQEYEVSFEAAVVGAYYGQELERADEEQRITKVPHDRMADVITAWDLGHSDATAIWFAQIVGREIHLIDYYEKTGEALDHYVKVIKSKPYVYSEHLLPHDVEAHELGTGKTRMEVLQQLGIQPTTVKRHTVDDGINAVRLALSRCWFDKEACERGIDCLRLYRAERDEKLGVFKMKPVHDWASDGADAFRYLIMGMDDQPGKKVYPQPDMSWVV
jgi:phage terminase large subunit